MDFCRTVLSSMSVSLTYLFRILGIFIDVGLGFGGHPIGVSNWYLTGAANHGWWGFCSVMVTAAFAFSGSEMVGLTAAEQENPERDMPRAIKKVFWRIGIVSHRILAPTVLKFRLTYHAT